MLYLHDKLKSFFSSSAAFDEIMTLQGECVRSLEGRKTQRVQIGDEFYFIKQHKGVGWREIFKNLLQLRLPILSAKNEKEAINKLASLNISVPMVLGYGKRGRNPAKMESFIILKELAPTVSLETFCADWKTSQPLFSFKQNLIASVAMIARTLHSHGINHRDFYICHFLLNCDNLTELSLIDLHRAQIRSKVPARWLIKDLAGLYFSSKHCGLTSRDLWRFLKQYRNKPLREIISNETTFWMKVKQRGEQLYQKHA